LRNSDNVAERECSGVSCHATGRSRLARGKTAMKAKNYTLANQEFKTAVSYLPDSVVSGKARRSRRRLLQSAVILAQARIAQAITPGGGDPEPGLEQSLQPELP